MNYEAIILFILSKLEYERTLNSAYHILRGKRSSQTIQDVHIFKLGQFYGIYPKLSIEDYQQIINQFIKESYIEKRQESFRLTTSGEEFAKSVNEHQLMYKGFQYHRFDQRFFQTLQLLCQTVSNLIYENNHFIPVIDELSIQQKVKKILKEKDLRNSIYNQLYEELYNLFERKVHGQVDWLVLQLTSAKRIGLSQSQIANMYNESIHNIYFETVHIVHQMLSLIFQNPSKYPVLYSILDFEDNIRLTQSAKKTYQLLSKGYTLDRICRYRNLKMSTIEDHIIEIATQISHFSIRPFVDEQVESLIQSVLEKTNSRKLKIIKDMLPDSVSYFQIRLVLAKWSAANGQKRKTSKATI